MRKVLIFAAVAALLLSACTSRSGRRNSPVQKVADLVVDSCQYDESGNILYFSDGSVAVKRFQGDSKVIVNIGGSDTVNADGTITIKNLIKILDDKCSPEPYSLICLRRFKEVIKKESLDSCSIEKLESADYYDFYLPSYKISVTVKGYVPFESKGEISIRTVDIVGEKVDDFCSARWEWSYEQQKEILQLLLAKKDKNNVKVTNKEKN